jgi:hypothetical protein
MAAMTIRNLPDETHRAIKLRAKHLVDTNVVSEAMKLPGDPRVQAWLDRQVEAVCI